MPKLSLTLAKQSLTCSMAAHKADNTSKNRIPCCHDQPTCRHVLSGPHHHALSHNVVHGVGHARVVEQGEGRPAANMAVGLWGSPHSCSCQVLKSITKGVVPHNLCRLLQGELLDAAATAAAPAAAVTAACSLLVLMLVAVSMFMVMVMFMFMAVVMIRATAAAGA